MKNVQGYSGTTLALKYAGFAPNPSPRQARDIWAGGRRRGDRADEAGSRANVAGQGPRVRSLRLPAPTWKRIRDAYWNPESDRLFTDRVFGVGWAVNLHRAKTLMEEAYRRLMGSPEPVSIRMTVRTEGRAKKPDVVITRE